MARKPCRVVWFGPNFQRVPAKTVKRLLGMNMFERSRAGACRSKRGTSNPNPSYTAVKVGGKSWKPALEVSKIYRQRFGRRGRRKVK